MSDGIMLTIGDDGEATLYDDTYDITIHCESKEEQDEVRKALENIPHWIQCSAELPKTNDPVNVTYVNHNPGNYYAEVKDKPYAATAHFHNGQWYWYSCTTQDLLDEYGTWIPDLIDKDVEITAWMPLPEPYKEVTT